MHEEISYQSTFSLAILFIIDSKIGRGLEKSVEANFESEKCLLRSNVSNQCELSL